jgi:zinc transporter ZupT
MGLGRKATGFLLVVGSGLATTLGAGVVLSPKLASLSNTKFLGAALAVSCGVMLYVLLPSSRFLTIS